MVILDMVMIYLTAFFDNFAFHPEMFVKNLKYMGVGMVCILVVIGVIIGLTLLLEKVSERVEKKKDGKDGH